MPGLPIALFAFAAGATLLQWQAALPRIALWFTGASVAAFGILGMSCISMSARRTGPVVQRCVTMIAALLVIAAAGAFGFGYAAWGR